MSTYTDSKDRQINPNPQIIKTGEGEFEILDLIWRPWAGRDWSHPLHAKCIYCHKEIKIVLRAPSNIPQFVLEEAKRVGITAHLRMEHGSKPKERNSN